jgi:SpoVK/Ycf46/Vps4 family AAA+-type ATPase
MTVVDFSDSIPLSALTPNLRVALRSDSYKLHSILPNKIDPLVSLMMVEKVPDSTYEMVGGLDKQIKEIKEVIELPVKHPELFESLGIAQPKGVLLYGPPGTGKTLLARAVAHHTDCRFIRVSGSELVQKYIGEGSRMVRELFVMAREHAPSIIFMDEIDSIGSSRGESGDSEVQRTMMELLNQLDGFESTKNIKVSSSPFEQPSEARVARAGSVSTPVLVRAGWDRHRDDDICIRVRGRRRIARSVFQAYSLPSGQLGRPMLTTRSSWQRTELISSIQHSFVQVESIGKLNFHHQTQKLGLRF